MSLSPGALTPTERREIAARWRLVREAYVYGLPVDDAPGYVRTWPDLDALAASHSLGPRKVRERAAAEGWEAARTRFQTATQIAGERARAEQRLRTSVLGEVDALVSVEKGLRLVRSRLEAMEARTQDWADLRARYVAAVAAGDLQTLEEIDYDTWTPHPVDVRDLKGLADAGKGYVEMLQTVLGTASLNVTISGPGGGPVQVDHIHRALSQDDPVRLHALIEAVSRAQIAQVVDGEVVEDEGDDEPD